MATYYVRSTTGLDTNDGLSWATARATLHGASLQDNAGDTIYVSQNHSESSAATIFFTWSGLTTQAVSVICANDSANPPTAGATSAVVNVTGVNSEIECAGNVYMYGIKMRLNGTGSCTVYLHDNANNCQMWEKCQIEMNSPNWNRIHLNSTANSSGDITWRNVDVKFGGTADSAITFQNDRFRWEGGSIMAGSFTPVGLFEMSELHYTDAVIQGVDFSNLATASYLLSMMGAGRLVLRNCKMPTNWSGSFFTGATSFTFRGEMYNCASGPTNIRVRVQEHMGAITDESTIIRSGGASDGVNAYSLKMSANGECNPAYSRLRSPEIGLWNDLTSATLTLNVEFAHDGPSPLTNRDVSLEVQYFSDSASPLASIASSLPADPVVTATALISSSVSWVTTGMAQPQRQKLSLTFTPMQRGYLQGRFVLAKDSYTVYVDPKLTVG